MKRKFVVDAGVLTLFYAGDSRVKPYFGGIKDAETGGYVSSINLSEHYYKTCQKLGKEVADLRYHQSMTILTSTDTDEGLTLAAGLEKCRRTQLSLADCFALALTKRLKGTLLTTDSELAKVKEITVKHFDVRV